jgi:hypothetical protein
VKRRRGIRSASPKRLGEAEERDAVIALTHARAGWRCEGEDFLPGACTAYGRGPDGKAWGLDCNELCPRGRGGSHLDPANTVSLCRGHHQHVTVNRGPEMYPWVQRRRPDGSVPGRAALAELPGWPS